MGRVVECEREGEEDGSVVRAWSRSGTGLRERGTVGVGMTVWVDVDYSVIRSGFLGEDDCWSRGEGRRRVHISVRSREREQAIWSEFSGLRTRFHVEIQNNDPTGWAALSPFSLTLPSS